MDNATELNCANSSYVFFISNVDKRHIENLKWNFLKNKKGQDFVCTRVNNQTMYLHHIIMRRTGIKQPSPKHIVSHINENKLDNRRENLHWITKSQAKAQKII